MIEVEAAPGTRSIVIEHPNEASKNLYVVGVNFTEIGQVEHHTLDIDAYAIYARSPGYVLNRGASDYVFKSLSDDTWAGSYHGGETSRSAPEMSLDHRTLSLVSGQIALGRRFSILQQTSLSWASSSSSMDIDSLTIFGDDSVYMACVARNVNATVESAHLGMTTSSPAFDSVLGGDAYYGAATTDGARYDIGQTQSATQIERTTGRLVTSEFSAIKDVTANKSVDFATGAYAKLYSNYVRNGDYTLPAAFGWAFKRTFH